MSYLVLARKWRPKSFDTLVGQDHVVRALTHALTTQRLHHAWLFTGTRGVGKTTLSRILAKSLNCETGITARPCGCCRACTEIDAGRFVDYVELDAASNRGVDEMTQLLEQAAYAPSAARFKVYMIDEVHMLSGHAFNAMLKTLEEPPPYVKFILATTDPQKIPPTVLSRCLQFNLKQMSADAIVGHLSHVLGEEGIPFETQALWLIAQAASGSMRDALSLTDQAIAYSAGSMTDEAVRGMLGTIDQRHLVRLLDALLAQDGSAILAVADELSVRGLSYSGALGDLAVLLSRIAVAQRVPAAISADDPLGADIVRLAQGMDADAIQLFYTVAVHGRGELALAPDEYAGFVMTVLRMLSLSASAGGAAGAPPVSGGADTGTARPAAVAAPVPNVAPAQSDPSAQSRTSTSSAPPAPATVGTASAAANPQQAAASDVAHDVTKDAASDGASGLAPVPAAASPAQAAVAAEPTVQAEPPPGVQAATTTVQPASCASDSANEAAAPSATADVRDQGPVTEPAVAAASPAADSAGISGMPEAAGSPVGTAAAPPDDDVPPWDMDIPAFPPSGDDLQVDDELDVSARSQRAPGKGRAAEQGAGQADARVASRRPAESAPHRARPAAPSPGVIALDRPWYEVAASLPVTGLASELARHSEWLGVQGNTIRLKVAARTLAEVNGRDRLRHCLEEYFGCRVNLDIEVAETGDGTAYAVDEAVRAERQRVAEETVQADPFVQELERDFDARVYPGSVRAVMPEASGNA
ncbi:DNA polymerase III subunit gamma/tau [Kerstersia gyiorum]|uniref:DNA polymerase III subunit gamma/tau n=1 Tax=Kerstersia gyiorum TaxID=206506 RepID=A0A171KSS7_9BURK|nr:DNA polymerase III subunit gamma/tau [Kerstersia gyiorum]KKO71944.1 DNA polymerase III subunit gamma/tau [Kerstersia gyiorum]